MRRLAEAHTEVVYRNLSIRLLYSLTTSRRGRRPVKGTNGSLHHSPDAQGRRNGDVLRQDADEAMGTDPENLIGTRSFRSSQRQGKPATGRREAGCALIKLQGVRNARGQPEKPRMAGEPYTSKDVRAVRWGGRHPPDLVTGKGAGSPPNIAELLQHGLLRASFVPPRTQRELREITRYRSKLVEERARLVNRIRDPCWRIAM